MKFLSVCSGIEAASVAWEPLAWEPLAFSEIEKFPSAVLSHHWPDIPNLGDMTRHNEWPSRLFQRPDLLVGGTPCQAFSVAGLRRGLEDPRGNLTLTYLAILEQLRPRWMVWENVPGVLSDKTRAFGAFLGGLGKLGYGFAYRILDAQHFGVAQRRRRVFVVGYLGDWRPPAAVLFEPESMRGDPPPSREAREGSASNPIVGTLESRHSGGFQSTDSAANGDLIPPTTGPLTAGMQKGPRGTEADESSHCIPVTVGTICADSHPGSYSGQDAYTGRLVAHTLRASHDTIEDGSDRGTPLVPVMGFDPQGAGKQTTIGASVDHTGVLGTTKAPAITSPSAVRRLTPTECERLQGFPDGHTLIPWRGKPAEECPDGPRYKALGNSMAVPVMRWIGERIQQFEDLKK